MRGLLIFARFALAAILNSSLVASASGGGIVDLSAAGCPAFPEPSRHVGVAIVLEEDGTAGECKIGSGWRNACGAYYDTRHGFVCLGFNGENPPISSSAEGPNSTPVSRYVVDGVEVPPNWRFSNSHFTAPFGSGPSGATYDVLAEQMVGTVRFYIRLTVTATAPDTIRIEGLDIRWKD